MAVSAQVQSVGVETSDLCPWCGHSIPHDEFVEIQKRIAAKERKRALEIERRLKEEQSRKLAELKASADVQIDGLQKEAAAAVEKANKAAKKQADAARKEGTRAAQAVFTQKLSEAEKAKAVAERQLVVLKAKAEKALNTRLQDQRDVLEKDKVKALNSERAKAFKERQKLDEKLGLLQRQLQKKTADELGEGAEVDLFEALKATFAGDDIQRVKKGEEGADIIHKVVYKDRPCGCIVYDSKNRAAWRNDYVSKLRRDQLAAKADHAILSSRVFPAGARQLHIQDGVIISNPARVIALVEMIRSHVVQMATLRTTNQAREQKMAQLYEFITSDRCAQLLDQIDTLADTMLELEVSETKAHQATWKRRGELIRSIQQTQGDLSGEIDQIIATPATPIRKVK